MLLQIQILTCNLILRINLGFDSRYLLTVNYRRDGTSRFSKENRWGNFSGAALRGTYLRNFLKDNSTLSNLKLRVDTVLLDSKIFQPQYD
jgi:iron complex outermembrane receptor protein